MLIKTLLETRRSTRAFLDKPVEETTIRDILEIAKWAPSGGNLQPWKVLVVSGEAKKNVINLAIETLSKNPKGEDDEFPIYPNKVSEPYRTRRFTVGAQLYELMGIERGDKMGRMKFFHDNLRFFGAPAGLFFVIDRSMGNGQWAHMGMFMQSIALAAEEMGLSTCMQESWALVRKTLHAHFQLPENELLYCGMALGWRDKKAKVNELMPERADLDEFVTFI